MSLLKAVRESPVLARAVCEQHVAPMGSLQGEGEALRRGQSLSVGQNERARWAALKVPLASGCLSNPCATN